MQKINFGVIGAGRIGELHLRNLIRFFPGVTVSMISDPRHEVLGPLQSEFSELKTTDNSFDVLDNPDVSAIAICSSTDTHAELISEAAKRGKNIFCEKPIDLGIEQTTRAIESVESSGVHLQVGFNRRFDPNFSRIREHVVSGKTGDLHLLNITSRDPGPPPIEYVKRSGGLFLDMAIHDFDMARFITGEEVSEVYAMGENRIDPAIKEAGDIDTAVINLRMESGTLCTINNSRKATYGYDQRVEAFGAKSCVSCRNFGENTVETWGKEGAELDPPHHFFLERYMESYLREMNSFVRSISGEQKIPVTGNDGLQALRIAMAANLSLKEKRVVQMGEVE